MASIKSDKELFDLIEKAAKEGKGKVDYDSLAQSSISNFDNWIKNGRDMANFKKSYAEVRSLAGEAGFGDVDVETTKTGWVIKFLPTDPEQKKIFKGDYVPQIEISVNENGVVLSDSMAVINQAQAVRTASGQIALISAMNNGLSQVAKNLREYNKTWATQNKTRDINESARLLAQTMRVTMDKTNKGPGHYTPGQREDYRRSIQVKNMKTITPYGIDLKEYNIDYNNYAQGVYKAYESKIKAFYKNKKNALNMWMREFDNLVTATRGVSSKAELERYLNQHYPWIKKNLWQNELENFFSPIIGVISQGGKKEGSPGVFGTQEIDLPFNQFGRVGRKAAQAQLIMMEKNNRKNAAGKNKLFTAGQLNSIKKHGINKNDYERDLYNVVELSDADIKWAYDFLKRRRRNAMAAGTWNKEKEKIFKKQALDAMKGFGSDASFISDTAMKDFKNLEVEDLKKGEVTKTQVDNIILKQLINEIGKSNSKQKQKLKTEEIADLARQRLEALQKGTVDKRNKKTYKDYVDNVIKGLFNLDDLDVLQGYDAIKDANGNITGYGNVRTKQYINQHSFTLRTDGSIRSRVSSLNDELLGLAARHHGYSKEYVYKNGDQSKGLNIGLAIQPLNLEKNMQDVMQGVLKYIINAYKEKTPNNKNKEIEEQINKSFFKGIISLNADGQFVLDSAALGRKIGKSNLKDKTDINGNVVSYGKRNAMGVLQEIINLGNTLQVAQLGGRASEYFEERNGKIIQKKLLPQAVQAEVFSGQTSEYTSLGNLSKSTVSMNKLMFNSIKGSLGEMERNGFGNAVAPMAQMIKSIDEKFVEKQNKYRSFQRNVDFTKRTFDPNTESVLKDVADNIAVRRFTLDELSKYGIDAKYVENGPNGGQMLINDPDNFVINYINTELEKEYMRLLKEYGEDELRKRGIFSAQDMQAFVDLQGKKIINSDDNGILSSGGVFLPGGTIENKDEAYILDEGAKATSKILENLFKLNSTDPNPVANAKKVGKKVYDTLSMYAQAVEEGSIWEKHNTLDLGKASGWLSAQALNENAQSIFTDLFGSKIQGKKGEELLNAVPLMFISAQDALASMQADAKTEEGRKWINSVYNNIIKEDSSRMIRNKKGEIIKDPNIQNKINTILKYYDINDANYSGAGLADYNSIRFPIIKGSSDIMGGKLAFSSNEHFVSHGDVRINADLLASAHGDMDGDKLAFFKALQSGDFEEAAFALQSFNKHLAEAQKQERIADEQDKSAELAKYAGAVGVYDKKKILALQDPTIRRLSALLQNASAPGAGVFGDQLFAALGAIQDKQLGMEFSSSNPKGSFAAQITSMLTHTLYQLGINPKNAKLFDSDAPAEVVEQIKVLREMSGKSTTWDELPFMLDFLKKTENLGITKADKVLDPELIADLNLRYLDQDSEKLNFMADIADKALEYYEENYGKKSEEYKRIKADYSKIQKIKKGEAQGLSNLSRELFAYIISGEGGFKDIYLNQQSEGNRRSFGQEIQERYFKSSNNFVNTVNRYKNAILTEETVEQLKGLGIEVNQANRGYSSNKGYGELGPVDKIFKTSPSRMLQNYFAQHSIYGDEQSLRDAILAAHSEDATEADKIALAQRLLESESDLSSRRDTIQGSIAHKASELLAKSGKGYADLVNDKAFFRKLYQQAIEEFNLESRKYDAGTEEYINGTGFVDVARKDPRRMLGLNRKELEQFILNSAIKGFRNYNFVKENVERQGGRFVGFESPLAGIINRGDGRAALSRGFADYEYLTYDEEGKPVWTIGDYKNYANGQPTIKNALQVKHYLELMRQLQSARFNNPQIQDSMQFLGLYEENEVAKAWKVRLDEEIEDLKKQYGYTTGKAQKIVYSNFDERFKIAGMEGVKFRGELPTRSENDVLTMYMLKESEQLNSLYEKFIRGEHDSSLEGNLKDITASSYTRGASVYSGEDVNQFLETFARDELKGINKAVSDIYKAKEKLLEIQTNINIASREISPNQATIEKLNQQKVETENNLKEAEKRYEEQLRNIEEIGGVVTDTGEKLKVDRSTYDALISSGQTLIDKQRENYEKIEKESARSPYAQGSKLLKQAREERYLAGLRLNDPRYSDAYEKQQTKDDIANLDATINHLTEKIAALESLFSEDEKKSLREEFSTAIDEKGLKKRYEVQKQQEELTFFNKAYGVYRQQNKFDTDIYKLDKQIAKAQESNDEEKLKLLQLEKENLQQQKALYESMFPDLKLMKGYTQGGAGKAKEKADLEAALERMRIDGKGSGQGRRSGFLGFDAYFMRWFDRLLSGGMIYTFIARMRRGLNDLINKAKQLDKAMTNLRIVTGENRDNARQLVGQYAKLGQELGATALEVTQAATGWFNNLSRSPINKLL